MKTLKDHTILYDGVCPICTLYTGAFVKSGMLDQQGRTPYQQMPGAYACQIDGARAVNEIALINRKTGEVHYGIKSLFLIIENAFPFFKPLFRWRPFAWLMDKCYKFISYNRRVIMPAAQDADVSSHQPSFNLPYRFSYLVFTWFITAFILSGYSKLLNGIIPAGNFYREFLVCGGQLFWQLAILFLIRSEKKLEYLGNMMTVSFAGGLLLVIAMLLGRFIDLSPTAFALYFMLVAAGMLAEHVRRMQLLRLNKALSLTWVLYRIFVLLIILYAS
jgi:predicted DCC family thiol-disulfide oxidoreductase YuxK